MTSPSSSEAEITKQLQQLRAQLGKKQTFEPAIPGIKSLLLESYASSSDPTQALFYDVVCRAATVVRTRYTAPGYLLACADLLEAAVNVAANPDHKSRLGNSLSTLRQHLTESETESQEGSARGRGGYLFEGHLTVDPESPQPNWLVQQNLLTALVSHVQANEGGRAAAVDAEERENMAGLFQGLVESLEESMLEGLDDIVSPPPSRRPPASKKAVEELTTKRWTAGEVIKCCICLEEAEAGDEVVEMPCKHLFHPLCLKPWFDKTNSCPVCRHELPTDDHEYESRKEREKELEEERRGAANAVRGGEFMYI